MLSTQLCINVKYTVYALKYICAFLYSFPLQQMDVKWCTNKIVLTRFLPPLFALCSPCVFISSSVVCLCVPTWHWAGPDLSVHWCCTHLGLVISCESSSDFLWHVNLLPQIQLLCIHLFSNLICFSHSLSRPLWSPTAWPPSWSTAT